MDFNKQITNVNSVTTEALITIPVEATNSAYEAEIKKASMKANLKGFRPGKAPRKMIEGIYGGRARMDAIDNVAREALNKTIQELDRAADLIGQPEVDFISLDPAKPLEFKATVYFFPRPTIEGYDQLSVALPEMPAVGTKEVDEALKRIAHSKAKLTKIEKRKKVQKGDVLVGVYQEREGDQEFSAEEKINIPLGDKFLPTELEDQLIGLEIAKDFETTISYPDDSDHKFLAGKAITYKIRVEEIMERELPELNEEFVKELKFQDAATVEDLKAKLASTIEKENQRYWEQNRQTAIIQAILDANHFDVPKLMVDQELKAMFQEASGKEPTADDLNKVPVEVQVRAEKQLRSGLALMQIARQEKLMATREDLQSHVEQVAADSGMDIKMLQDLYLNNQQLAQSLQSEITTKKVFDFLESKISGTTVVSKKASPKKEAKPAKESKKTAAEEAPAKPKKSSKTKSKE